MRRALAALGFALATGVSRLSGAKPFLLAATGEQFVGVQCVCLRCAAGALELISVS